MKKGKGLTSSEPGPESTMGSGLTSYNPNVWCVHWSQDRNKTESIQ